MSASVANVKSRLLALCGDVPGVVTVAEAYDEDERPFEASELPAIVVRVTWQASVAREAADSYLMTMLYDLELVVALSSGQTALVDSAALAALEPWAAKLIDFFARRRRLERNDSGLAVACDMLQVLGSSRAARGGVSVARLHFRLPVTTRHRQTS